MENVLFLTPEGFKELQDKLEFLKTVKRQEVSKKIGVARDFGDLSENAEYDAAKEEQGEVEAEIEKLEESLRTAKIIDKRKIDTSKVNIGCCVKLHDIEFGDDIEYQIIGSAESDPVNGLISNESPVGKALMGKKKGDIIEVKVPAGKISYKVLGISVK